MPPLEATGMVVRAARVKRGWTQQRAAAEAGVSRKQWALLERGENISVVFLRKVARALDLRLLPLGEGVEGDVQGAGSEALAIADIANELAATAERLRALAFESMLPPSMRGRDTAAIGDFIHAEEEAGLQFGPILLALPTGTWRSEMQRDPNLRRYGTLQYVLKVIREDLFHTPVRARERAAIVVHFAEQIDAPIEQYRVATAGLAWKEYANALRYVGEFAEALRAANRSYEWVSAIGALRPEAAKAQLVEALIRRELGEHDRALSLARACAGVFRDSAESEALVHARMTEALVLSDCKRHKEALDILSETAADAERRGDRHTLAICLHNCAEASRALGDHAAAATLDAKALEHFEDLGTSVEKPRVRWARALTLAAEGQIPLAVSELYLCRAELLALGMNTDAACCNLDLVRIQYERGEDVTAICTDLVETFSKAGMIPSAIEALAYVREQSRHSTLSAPKISKVRDFICEVAKGPSRLFLPHTDDTEAGA